MTLYELAISTEEKMTDKLCGTTTFLIPFSISTIISTVFVAVGCKINKAIN
jgi:hypothetical protein